MRGLFEALGIGLLSQSSLILGGLIVYWVTIPRVVLGTLAGFGAGALVAAISFDLLAEADSLTQWQLGLWMLLGVAIFLLGDRAVERRFGDEGTGRAMGIVVGSVVDGVPESIILGVAIASGEPMGAAFIAAIMVSNLPQAIAPSADLARAGWGAARLGKLWTMVVLACGVAAVLGWVAGDISGDVTGAAMAAIAAGGLLAMLTDSLIPFAYERGRDWAGAATVVGFVLSLGGT